MFKNLIKVAIRNLLKHKSYSMINIAGLAGSIAVTILILIYAQSILTYDQFHADADQIYFMYRDRPTEDGRLEVFDTWYPMVDAAKEEFPSIAEGTRSLNIGNTMIQKGDKRFEQSLTYADSNFFDVFSFPLIQGDPATALDQIDAVIISEEVANKFFGEEDPIGQTLTFGFNTERVVTGVLGQVPSNSSFTFECIVPLNHQVVTNWLGDNLWGGSFCNSFIKLKPGADEKQLASQLHILMDKYVVEQERGDFLILPLKDYFDKMTGQKKYAYIMLIVGFGILFIAIINFANLSTSQSLLRTKEVGVRKVLGANKGGLVGQFIGESMIMSLIALLLGGLLAELLLPTFNDLIGIQLDIIYSPFNLLLMLLLALAIGFISGSYPALFVSRMKSVSIFKGDKVSGKMTVRNLLVSIQFILAIALMGSLGVIMQQIDFMKLHDLNFDQDNVMVVPLSLRDFEDPQSALPRVVSFRNELKKLPGVEAVTGSNSVPGNYRRSFTLFLPKGKEDMPPLDWQVAVVDHDFFITYGVDVLEGRSYIQGSANDFEHGVILNRTAMEQIGWTSIEGKKLLFPRSREELDIVGLVEDFNVQSLRDPVQPLVHYYGGDSARSYRFISIKLNPKSRENTLASIASTWEKMDFGLTYEYYFPAERFRDLYETEENIANVLTYAMILAIVISCLGLYALASFSVMLKTKEIAIRKVLGASISSIIGSFSKQYLYIVLASAIPAVVISWYGMSDWLHDFAYRINIGPSVYILAILSAIVIAFITVSYHALKAGITNPVDSLKEE